MLLESESGAQRTNHRFAVEDGHERDRPEDQHRHCAAALSQEMPFLDVRMNARENSVYLPHIINSATAAGVRYNS
jgi:hypothetical protein